MADFKSDSALPDKSLSVEDQATKWFSLMQSNTHTENDIIEHRFWLTASLTHRRAYSELKEIWTVVGDFANRSEVRAARNQVQEAFQHSNNRQQGDLQGAAATEGVNKKSMLNLGDWISLAVAVSLLIMFLGSNLLIFKPWGGFWHQGVYQTKVGEQKIVTLSDGSILVLDTQTRVTTEFSAGERRVELKEGQARFDVARDQTRPFIVEAGNGMITALGTAFVVRKDENEVLITLIEGNIKVEQEKPFREIPRLVESKNVHKLDGEIELEYKSEWQHAVTLEQGQQVAYSSVGISAAGKANLDHVTAWQQGRLVFEGHSLEEVIEDLNRYSQTKIILEDDPLKRIRITGVFKIGDQLKTVQALQAYFSISIRNDRNGNVMIHSADEIPVG